MSVLFFSVSMSLGKNMGSPIQKSLLVVVYPGSMVCCQVGRALAPVIFSLYILWSKWKNIFREHHDPFYFSFSTLRVLSAR